MIVSAQCNMNTKLRMHTKCIYVNTYLGTKNGTWELPLVWFTPFLCTDYADLISNDIQCKILKGFETISDCIFVK